MLLSHFFESSASLIEQLRPRGQRKKSRDDSIIAALIGSYAKTLLPRLTLRAFLNGKDAIADCNEHGVVGDDGGCHDG